MELILNANKVRLLIEYYIRPTYSILISLGQGYVKLTSHRKTFYNIQISYIFTKLLFLIVGDAVNYVHC